MRRLRILIVSGIFHPEVGGPATYLHELACTLTKDGHTVGVVAYGSPDVAADYPFRVWRVPRRGHPLSRMVRFAGTLLRVGRGFPVWYVNDYGIPAVAAASVLRSRVAMKIVGDFAWEYSRRNGLTADGIDMFQTKRYGWRIQMLKAVQRFYIRRATCVIVPSAYLRGVVEGWGVPPARVRVIYNAVNIGSAADHPPGRSDRRTDGLVLTAARLTSWKGVDTLLRALVLLRAACPDARLVVAGGGPEQQRLTVLASELGLEGHVEWLGDVTRAMLLEWMTRARVFVLLSEYEGFSHVLLEALASGLPVVASTAGGNPELVRHEVDGLLVAPGDVPGAATALESLLRDSERWQNLANAARRRAGDFTWPRLIEETTRVFASVGAGAGSSV